MQNKLQELTEKIYQEGITKGKTEAEEIISGARKEAEIIVSEAKKEAENILRQAKKKSGEIKANGEAELKLSSRQALNALKQQITDLIGSSITRSSVSEALEDAHFIQKIIEISVKNWMNNAENPSLTILVPEKEEKKLNDYFNRSARELLDKGLKITAGSGLESGFQISPKDGSYKISFSEEDFINFFKQYLRPRLVELLFGEE